jgi:hypothetical protein
MNAAIIRDRARVLNKAFFAGVVTRPRDHNGVVNIAAHSWNRRLSKALDGAADLSGEGEPR